MLVKAEDMKNLPTKEEIVIDPEQFVDENWAYEDLGKVLVDYLNWKYGREDMMWDNGVQSFKVKISIEDIKWGEDRTEDEKLLFDTNM